MYLIVNEICTVFHFLALYFEKIALLLANQIGEIFACIMPKTLLQTAYAGR